MTGPLGDVLLQLIPQLGFHCGVSMTAVVHKQQVGVIVVEDVERVSLEVIHDVLSREISLESTRTLVFGMQGDIMMTLLKRENLCFLCVSSCDCTDEEHQN